ncbi:MAG: GNAT family N-acetyltransferase [Phycisphaerales bacterium]|nr:GNAT family N-acetyltransferase [Phycisphaerales bacterium]
MRTLPIMSDQITIRTASSEDMPCIRGLFEAGVHEGKIQINDSGADIENLEAGYFHDEGRSNFWVAESTQQVVGMIGVQCVGDEIAEIRRLRVHGDFRRRGIGTDLLNHALQFCRKRDYVKIVLEVRVERDPAIHLFEKAGFFLARSRESDGHKTLDFYVDLYTDPATRS